MNFIQLIDSLEFNYYFTIADKISNILLLKRLSFIEYF